MNKLAVAILLGSFVIAVAILLNSVLNIITKNSNAGTDPEKIYQNISYIKTTGSPFLGDSKSPITIIEYVDFECPLCKKVYDDIMPRLKQEYLNTGKAKFVFKNLPIEELHRSAYIKSEAAFCAFEQGGNAAFFAYHDELFNKFSFNPFNSVEEELYSIAGQKGLDVSAFRNCLGSEKYKPQIKKEKVEAIAINTNGTPTWLIGKTGPGGSITGTIKINGLHNYEVYKTVIDQLMTNE